MNSRKSLLCAVSALCVALSVSAAPRADSPSAPAAAAKPLPTIRLAGGDTGYPNPFRHQVRGPGMAKMQLLYDSLLDRDEKGDIPWLASSWKIDASGTRVIFTLRENAFWHDGKPFTAEDVAFTFAYYEKFPPVSNDLIVDGSYIVKGTKVVDPRTVEIAFSKYDVTFLGRVGWARILPEHVWKKVADPKTYAGEGAGIGSGPYVLSSYDATQGSYRYLANERYWGPRPAAAAIEWIPAGDPVLAFESGQIDLMNASADVIRRYEGKAEYAVKKAPSYHSYRLMMNMEKRPELADRAVRKALAYAIDRQALVDKVDRGSATVSPMGYVPETSPWYSDDQERYAFDPARAKELLGGRSLSFELLVGNTNPEIKIAELIALNLSAVGVTATVKSVDGKVRDSAVVSGKYELLLVNSGGMGGDPDYLRSIYGKASSAAALSQSYLVGYSNPRIDALCAAQAQERDPAKRKAILAELQRLIADEVPMVMLQGAVDNFVYRPGKYSFWMFRYDHSKMDHNKLSYLIRTP